MKKLYTSFFAVAAAMTVCAQQLPNVGFEGAFEPKAPWTSAGNTCYNAIIIDPSTGDGSIATLNSPEGWTASNVIGIPTESEGTPVGLGATGVVAEVEGYKSNKAIKVYNSPNSIMPTQIVPGYLTLGTTWSTSVMGTENDGGTWGGIEYAARPDALSFYYKRERVSAPEDADEYSAPTYKPEEPSTIVAYLWNGTWTQKDVPGDIQMFGAPTVCDMVDRDRNILGMETAKGGEVVASENAKLVAVLNTNITEEAADWTLFVQPLEYKSDAIPSKANVILAAGDYFGGAEVVGRDNSLTVDDVRFVYYSRLASISVNGSAIEGFDSKKFDYDLTDVEMPESETGIAAELLKNVSEATATTTLDKANAVATIKVVNANGADFDGNDTHTYTIRFKKESEVVTGTLDIVMMGSAIAENQPATLEFVMTDENTCTITLPDFSLDLGSGMQNLGDIVVPNVSVTQENDMTKYAGNVEGMSLMGGALVADVTLEGTRNAAGMVNMNINVVWNNIPIVVTFNGQVSGISSVVIDNSNAPVEYYNLNGMRVAEDNLTPGLYIRRQGTDVKKVYVK